MLTPIEDEHKQDLRYAALVKADEMIGEMYEAILKVGSFNDVPKDYDVAKYLCDYALNKNNPHKVGL